MWGHLVVNALLIMRSSVKWSRSKFSISHAVWGRARSCWNVIVPRHLHCCTSGMTISCNTFRWRSEVIEKVWNNPFHPPPLKKKDSIIIVAVKPSHAVTWGEFKGSCWTRWGFSVDQIQQLYMFIVPRMEKWASSVYRMFHDQFCSTSISAKNVKANVSFKSLSPGFTSCNQWIIHG